MSKFRVRDDFRRLLRENNMRLVIRDAVFPGENKNLSSGLDVEYENATYAKVMEYYGKDAADEWAKVKASTFKFYDLAMKYMDENEDL